MGYSTEFEGFLTLSRPATTEERTYINTFAETRRMKRDPSILKSLYNGNHGLNGEYGVDGEFFARNDGDSGQSRDESILEYNKPPSTQPGLWCQWVLTDDGQHLEWDQNEKFSEYVEWLAYMIEKFFEPWGIKLSGEIRWFGDDRSDMGAITVNDNIITVDKLKIVKE